MAQINARPRTDKEWDEIEQEISSIQRLTPGDWYGEYLQNRVTEANRGGRSSPCRQGGRPRLGARGTRPRKAATSVLSRLPSPPRRRRKPLPQPGEEPLGLPSLPAGCEATHTGRDVPGP